MVFPIVIVALFIIAIHFSHSRIDSVRAWAAFAGFMSEPPLVWFAYGSTEWGQLATFIVYLVCGLAIFKFGRFPRNEQRMD